MSLLCRVAAKPSGPKDDAGFAELSSCAPSRGGHELLLGHPIGCPGGGPLGSAHSYGTTAWRISMGRRQVVESVNAALKGSFVDLTRGFVQVFGRVKTSVLLGFTLAAFNLDRIRSFRAKHDLEEGESVQDVAGDPSPRKNRRRGTWAQIIERDHRRHPPNHASRSFIRLAGATCCRARRTERDASTRNRRPLGRRFRRAWDGGRVLNSSPPPTEHFHEQSASLS